ncbi:MAG TPA: hypothetical protein VNR87_08010 [Flavisolibacter sp.]|nr:hypothetical protein [Flavisolibacter sp.]
MKILLCSLVVLIGLAPSLRAQDPCLKNLFGKWESSAGAGIEVLDSSHIFIVYGKEKKQVASYQADFSKSPCWFDFTIRDSGQSFNVQSLLLFVSNDVVQWQVFDEGTRPSAFTSGRGEMVYMRRKR